MIYDLDRLSRKYWNQVESIFRKKMDGQKKVISQWNRGCVMTTFNHFYIDTDYLVVNKECICKLNGDHLIKLLRIKSLQIC